MARLHNEKGLSLVDVMVFIGVISILFGVTMQQLNQTINQRALLRKSSLTKKAFGGAEIVLIDQRQCRCNFLNVALPANPGANTVVNLPLVKTFFDVDGCANNAADIAVADTANNALTEIRSSSIFVGSFESVVPEAVYRARLFLSPTWGRPVSFPILFHTSPVPGGLQIDICGVDRES